MSIKLICLHKCLEYQFSCRTVANLCEGEPLICSTQSAPLFMAARTNRIRRSRTLLQFRDFSSTYRFVRSCARASSGDWLQSYSNLQCLQESQSGLITFWEGLRDSREWLGSLAHIREFNYRMSMLINWSTEQELFRTIKYLLMYTQSVNITSLPLSADYDAKAHDVSHITIPSYDPWSLIPEIFANVESCSTLPLNSFWQIQP